MDATFRRMTLRQALTITTLALLAAPATSHAIVDPTIAQSLAIADAFHGAYPCAGQVQVLIDPTLPARGRDGEAYSERCEIAVAPGLDPVARCDTIVHEVGHLKYGPSHDGPMRDENLRAPQCHPTPRQEVIAGVRGYLPPSVQWRIVCGRNSPYMNCRASSTKARYVRRFAASITTGEVTFEGMARR